MDRMLIYGWTQNVVEWWMFVRIHYRLRLRSDFESVARLLAIWIVFMKENNLLIHKIWTLGFGGSINEPTIIKVVNLEFRQGIHLSIWLNSMSA